MKRAPDDSTDLLADVLAEGAPAEFRPALLGVTLRLARRRRWRRHAGRAVSMAAVASAVALTVWWGAPRGGVPVVMSAPNCAIVSTQPSTASLVVTAPSTAVAHVSTADHAWRPQLLGDDELLALVGSQSAALVRVGPGAQELIFVTPVERAAPPPN